MIKIEAPGQKTREIDNIIFDLNGTLTVDGRIHAKTTDKINLLAKRVRIYVMTADTRGDSRDVLRKVKGEIVSIDETDTGRAKADFLNTIGAQRTVAVGNGYND